MPQFSALALAITQILDNVNDNFFPSSQSVSAKRSAQLEL
jgi:hypothetical protein